MDLGLVTMMAGFFQDIADWIINAIEDFVSHILYYLQIGFFYIIKAIEGVVKKLVGLDIYYANGEPQNGDIVVGFLQNTTVRDTFISILIAAVFLLLITTFIAILKSEFNEREKGNSKVPIIEGAIKAVVYFAVVPVVCIMGIFVANVVLRMLNSATNRNAASFSNQIFVAAAYDANKLRQPDKYVSAGEKKKIIAQAKKLGYAQRLSNKQSVESYIVDAVEKYFYETMFNKYAHGDTSKNENKYNNNIVAVSNDKIDASRQGLYYYAYDYYQTRNTTNDNPLHEVILVNRQVSILNTGRRDDNYEYDTTFLGGENERYMINNKRFRMYSNIDTSSGSEHITSATPKYVIDNQDNLSFILYSSTENIKNKYPQEGEPQESESQEEDKNWSITTAVSNMTPEKGDEITDLYNTYNFYSTYSKTKELKNIIDIEGLSDANDKEKVQAYIDSICMLVVTMPAQPDRNDAAFAANNDDIGNYHYYVGDEKVIVSPVDDKKGSETIQVGQNNIEFIYHKQMQESGQWKRHIDGSAYYGYRLLNQGDVDANRKDKESDLVWYYEIGRLEGLNVVIKTVPDFTEPNYDNSDYAFWADFIDQKMRVGDLDPTIMDDVDFYYLLRDYNFIIGFIGSYMILTMLLNLMIGVMQRIFEICVLFVLSPAVVSLMPLDNGEKYKMWRGEFIKRVFSAYGPILGMNLAIMVLEMIQSSSITLFPTGGSMNTIYNDIINILFIFTALVCIKSITKLVSSFVGSSALDDGEQTAKAVKDLGMKTVGQLSSAAAIPGRAAKNLLNAYGNHKDSNETVNTGYFGKNDKGEDVFLTKEQYDKLDDDKKENFTRGDVALATAGKDARKSMRAAAAAAGYETRSSRLAMDMGTGIVRAHATTAAGLIDTVWDDEKKAKFVKGFGEGSVLGKGVKAYLDDKASKKAIKDKVAEYQTDAKAKDQLNRDNGSHFTTVPGVHDVNLYNNTGGSGAGNAGGGITPGSDTGLGGEADESTRGAARALSSMKGRDHAVAALEFSGGIKAAGAQIITDASGAPMKDSDGNDITKESRYVNGTTANLTAKFASLDQDTQEQIMKASYERDRTGKVKLDASGNKIVDYDRFAKAMQGAMSSQNTSLVQGIKEALQKSVAEPISKAAKAMKQEAEQSSKRTQGKGKSDGKVDPNAM